MPSCPDEHVVDEQIEIAAPIEPVWHAITDPDARSRWWGHLDLDPRVGGQFEERWNDPDGNPIRTHGEVIEIIPTRMIRLQWTDGDWSRATEVHVTLNDEANRTTVCVRHLGWSALPEGPALAAAHKAGWSMHLENLRVYVEQAAGQ